MLAQDIRHALRSFARNPGFTLAAVLSPAIGIGANTSIFSVANALLLCPLSYKDASRLVILWNRSPGLDILQDWFSTAQYLDIKNGHHGFEEVAVASGGNDNLTGEGEPRKTRVAGLDPRIAFYLTQTQYPSRAMTVVMRSQGDPSALSPSIKKELRGIDPDLPMYSVRTMDDRVEESLARRRFSMLLLGLFAGVALALATIGIYGVMAYLVNQGTREIGIRMALGATQREILRLVVFQGMTLAGTGVATGLAAAFVLTRLFRSLLFGINAADPVTFGAISLLLAVVALLATYIPAKRAARVDPILCLRSE